MYICAYAEVLRYTHSAHYHRRVTFGLLSSGVRSSGVAVSVTTTIGFFAAATSISQLEVELPEGALNSGLGIPIPEFLYPRNPSPPS